MEILPKHVINKIFLFLEHPTATIIQGETIFKFMAVRHANDIEKQGRAHPLNVGGMITETPPVCSNPENVLSLSIENERSTQN